ncbi:YqcC family protein [Shewanella sp. MR-4]|uniref:YqcC family protein n=1 Tax=Shewanella sp. (strain MR-4) TaxID=60480 RepID=UPI00030352DC|nr:YqcC family protein [Shewanella sp. MR-4]
MLYSQTQTKLAQIAHELQSAGLWSTSAPSDEAMASMAPFACDLMSLEQWLQFIFIPRMQALIDAGQPLPSKIAIAPMAEHVWSEQAALAPLIGVLNELDMLLNEPR